VIIFFLSKIVKSLKFSIEDPSVTAPPLFIGIDRQINVSFEKPLRKTKKSKILVIDFNETNELDTRTLK